MPRVHALVEGAYRGEGARRGWTHEADLLGGQRTDPEMITEMIASAGQRLLLALDGDVLRGCVLVAGKGEGLAYLGLLTVDPVHQATGLGSRLIAAAETLARGIFGAERIEMTVIAQRHDLIAWYARRGYLPTGETRPFPFEDRRFGCAKRSDLHFIVLARSIA